MTKKPIDLKSLNNWLRKIDPNHPNLKQKQPAFGKINPVSGERSPEERRIFDTLDRHYMPDNVHREV